MKVIKFGGSSLASATQLEKVLNIVKSDPERRFVVVSAPGKRNDEDTKVTDALIKYYKHYTKGADVKADQEWIINRYQADASTNPSTSASNGSEHSNSNTATAEE